MLTGRGELLQAAWRVMVHNPFSVLFPCMITVSFLIISILQFGKITIQSSSQSWPRETREPVLRSSKMKAFCAFAVRLLDKGTEASLNSVVMVSPLATATSDPVTCLTFSQIGNVLLCKK